MSQGRMIFYLTRPLDDGIASGSRLRPQGMLAGFRAIGLEVETVTGSMSDRLMAIRRTRSRIEAGECYDYLYMENATVPLHFTEPRLRLLRSHPFLDAAFLRLCRRHGIPIGIFNNDIYWRFAGILPGRYRLRYYPFHLLELGLFARLADVLYVPHPGMLQYLPFRFRRTAALMHGAPPRQSVPAPTPPLADDQLRLFYVGGLGSAYRLHVLVDAVRRSVGVTLTICCRPDDWQHVRHEYEPLLSAQVRVIHAQGAGLLPHFQEAHLLSAFWQPVPYMAITIQVKLFEYLSHDKPILAAQGTTAGEFVATHDIGWSVPHDADALVRLFARLRARPAELAKKGANVARILPEHTWQARARQVVQDLSSLRWA